MGNVLKGTVWFATIVLATVGALTFVPDTAWESFPSSLSSTRSTLARIGVAPVKYARSAVEPGVAESVEPALPVEGAPGVVDSDYARAMPPEAAPELEPRVKIGGRSTVPPRASNESQQPAESRFEPYPAASQPQADAPISELPASPAEPAFDPREFMPERDEEAPLANPAVNSADLQDSAFDDFPAGTDSSFFGDSTPTQSPATLADPADQFQGVSTPAPTNPAFAGPAPEKDPDPALGSIKALGAEAARQVVGDLRNVDDEIPPMPQPNPGAANTPAPNPALEPRFADPTAPLDAANALLDSTPALDPNCDPIASPPQGGLGNAQSAARNLAQTPAQTELAQYDAQLEATLTSAQRIETAEQARTVFLTLNELRRAYVRLGADDRVDRVNGALDQLAYEVFYNPQRAILEPMYVTRQGDTIASVARQYQVAPETLAAINGLAQSVEAPLPHGASLKVVRGPVKAELSESKKELLLSFNNLYAGRFKFGTPQQATNLRGEYLVEKKIDNPACDAMDTTGATITIPGGSSENPLGSCWIGLQGGYGLQGTNRPELIGTVVPENGGFIFSNREISQLSVLLPVGASVYFND